MAAMVKKPVTGMKDILPQEMAVRNYVTSLIRETYASFGFSSIETPAVEHIENLLSKQGGENEKLIFKILKRGEKLDLQNAKTEEDVADSGLRYDLTLPLARYYACHAADLPSPFKALQIGNVFRAERNQKGRFRQFTQCDIDILGDPSCFAEIDLILATSTVLTKLGFKGFRIRINDRAILKHMAAKAGFQESDFEKVFITIDKMDKIGMSGVREDLLASYPAEIVDSYLEGLGGASSSGDGFSERDEALMREVGSPLPEIIRTVMRVKNGDYSVVYDPTLVRGMGYYTGPIFEISMDEFGSSVGGGGRYDEMIGRFTGQKTPAVGFSIGFERIIMVLLEKHFEVPGEQDRAAFLIEKKMPEDRLPAIWQEAMELRAAGRCVDIAMMKKNRKFQKEQLAAEGYGEIREFFVNELL
ncbi:MAG: histidine--tRNA ligase [Lachnospiraceae bacterium]|nr:histidine--tRNA ligase [Lachnospiraceae bacterium]